jgi:hypothetical protein
MRFLFSAVREYSFDGNSKTPKWTSKRERQRERELEGRKRKVFWRDMCREYLKKDSYVRVLQKRDAFFFVFVFFFFKFLGFRVF